MFVTLDHPTEGDIRQARPSAKFSESPAAIQRMAPRLGEHSRVVLKEAGLSDEEIAALVEKKAVGVSG